MLRARHNGHDDALQAGTTEMTMGNARRVRAEREDVRQLVRPRTPLLAENVGPALQHTHYRRSLDVSRSHALNVDDDEDDDDTHEGRDVAITYRLATPSADVRLLRT